MNDIKEVLERFYRTGRWERGFEERIKNAITRFISREGLESSIRRLLGDSYLEDIYSTFILRLLSSKELLLSKREISFGYLTAMIKNTVMDVYRKRALAYEVSIHSLWPDNEDDLEEVIFRTAPPSYHPLELLELFDKVVGMLDDKDRETLCYYIAKELGEKFEMKDLSKDALYKRWERLKKKLGENLSEINEELWRAFMDMYMSEVCDKIR